LYKVKLSAAKNPLPSGSSWAPAGRWSA